VKRCQKQLSDGSICGRPTIRGSEFCLEHDPYDFTEEDEFGPRYCRDCGRQTPAALLKAQDGLCNECKAAHEREAQRKAAEAAALEKAEAERREAERAAVYSTDTGMGQCPACGSRNISQFTTGGADHGAQVAFGCCSCLFIAWPLAFLAPFLFRRPETLHARCNSCGHTWLI